MSVPDVPLAVQREPAVRIPYPLSFIDSITKIVQRLPIHYGLTYFLVFIILAAGQHVIAWNEGWLAAPQISRVLLLFPLYVSLPLAIVTYLDSVAAEALAKFSPLLDISLEEKERLAYEFSTMPARSVIINSLVWSAIFCIYWFAALDTLTREFGFGAASTVSLFIVGLLSFFVGSVIYYHTFRQLRLVHRTVKLVGRFDVFRLDPVYAFSVLTSRTGICWIILSSLSVLVSPVALVPVQAFMTLTVQFVLAIAAFFLPLRVVYRRITLEKQRQLAELDLRIKETLARLHECIDQKRFADADEYNGALGALVTEGQILAKIPTLPWRPGLFTGFLSVVVLPILLFLLQLAIERLLTG